MASLQEKIPGGFYIKARCIQESDISKAPPHIREIWDWFLMNANHKDRGKIKRGQLLTSYNNILNGLCWYVGYRKCSYTKAQCETAMKYLTSRTMIATTRTTRGMIVTVLNYDKFQDVKNYENHNETEMKPTREPHESRHDTQECKKEIKTNIPVGGEPPPENLVFDFYKKHIRLNGNYDPTPSKNNIKAWLKEYQAEELIEAIKNYATVRVGADPKYNKSAKNFFGRAGESKGYFKDYLKGVFSKTQKTFNSNRLPEIPENPYA